MIQVVCPGCRAKRTFGADVRVGAVVSCESCAGVVFRLVQDHGTYLLHQMPQASCPVCGTMLRLPDAVQAGATTDHCAQTLVVTYAYGAYALERANGQWEEGMMRRIIGQQACFMSLLILMACLVMSCRDADSGASETPNQSGAMHAQAGGEQLQRITLHITGMSWGAWPRIVQLALARLEGVHNVEVSFRTEQAVVTYDPGKVTVPQMIDAVGQSGFGAEKVP